MPLPNKVAYKVRESCLTSALVLTPLLLVGLIVILFVPGLTSRAKVFSPGGDT